MRIGDFNPSLQGPVEPPYSLSDYILELESYNDEDVNRIEINVNQLRVNELEIARLEKANADTLKNIERLSSRVTDNKSYIKEMEEEDKDLRSEIESTRVEIELLKEDPGNEEKVLRLETRIRDINNRL